MLAALSDYSNIIRSFSRNAKLYLAFCCFAGGIVPGGFVLGLWATVFNLYLLEIGFQKDFVGLVLQMEFLGHGLLVFPFGLLSDAIGRRRTFIVAALIAALFSALQIFTVAPLILLALSFMVGVGRGAHAVVGSPFMMENSNPRERPYLYSMAQVLSLVWFMVGASVGGSLPDFLYKSNGFAIDASYRLTLLLAVPLLVLALVPIYLISEKPVAGARRATLSNLKSYPFIGMLVLTTGLFSLGFGFVQPMFNIFFAGLFGAVTFQVGLIFSLGAVGSILITFLAPMFVRRLGRVPSVFLSQVASVVFLMVMPLGGSLTAAASAYVARMSLYSLSQPIRQMYSMEILHPEERASTEGLTHLFFDVPAAVPTALAGAMMARNNYLSPYIAATILQLSSAVIFFSFFRKLRVEDREAIEIRAATR